MESDDQEQLPVTPAVITWARQRSGYSLQEAARYFRSIDAWEQGRATPTYSQLESMAEKFKCPVAVFFFPGPPDVESPEQSFRTLTEHYYALIPRPIKTLLRKAQAMQVNLAELNDKKNPARKLITSDLKFPEKTPVQEMAATVRDYLGISLEEQCRWPTSDVALEKWREVFTKVGVFVFKDAFHIEGYFGFCLYDDEFPIVYVNNSAAKTRQIFTLFHELAHLLSHTSGIDLSDDSFVDELPKAGKDIEVICNKFAGEFLVPDTSFEGHLASIEPGQASAAALADVYNVSREVIYRKMLDRHLVSADEYLNAARAWAAEARSRGSGGNYYYNQFTYLGSQYIDLAFRRYYQHRFDETRLAEYLNIKPKNLSAFEQLYERG